MKINKNGGMPVAGWVFIIIIVLAILVGVFIFILMEDRGDILSQQLNDFCGKQGMKGHYEMGESSYCYDNSYACKVVRVDKTFRFTYGECK